MFGSARGLWCCPAFRSAMARIGAGSVVSRDIPPYAVAVGNPAGVIRFRFAEDTIARLLEIRWWDWSDEVILDRLNLFYGPIEKFIETVEP
jgi:hypothetical protein